MFAGCGASDSGSDERGAYDDPYEEEQYDDSYDDTYDEQYDDSYDEPYDERYDEPYAQPEEQMEPLIDENGSYTHAEDVALYIHTYGRLPSNFITKKEARALGWSGGRLEKYATGMCIGGDRFGNYEGLLPDKKGRTYTECDIDTLGAKSRGAKRIVFSNDGLIYYTEDHYESFTLLYGEE
ncbi:MAG: ribonuclease [Clostridia bacterium]|nr:ribonuclease [Clostridia bacterium]